MNRLRVRLVRKGCSAQSRRWLPWSRVLAQPASLPPNCGKWATPIGREITDAHARPDGESEQSLRRASPSHRFPSRLQGWCARDLPIRGYPSLHFPLRLAALGTVRLREVFEEQ